MLLCWLLVAPEIRIFWCTLFWSCRKSTRITASVVTYCARLKWNLNKQPNSLRNWSHSRSRDRIYSFLKPFLLWNDTCDWSFHTKITIICVVLWLSTDHEDRITHLWTFMLRPGTMTSYIRTATYIPRACPGLQFYNKNIGCRPSLIIGVIVHFCDFKVTHQQI